jgi:2-methylcitrate dehydratase PrpD
MAAMDIELELAGFVSGLKARDIPPDALRTTRLIVLAAAGTAVAGSGEDGIAGLRRLLLERGGARQARSFVFGDALPASAAAQLNGTMCRALDYCDAMAPGVHIGSSLIPAAFAAADLRGGCRGSDFMAALAAGAEIGSRFNLSEAQYDGFDPTGVAAVFAATAAASRVLELTPAQTLHALALAFNRCGGSFQSNIDGSLAVRLIQGWVAETGVSCAQMAQHGLTGPVNFVSGIYGYAHLYGRGRLEPRSVTEGLGRDWRLNGMMFKKYPSCGLTQGLTELTLNLVERAAIRETEVRSVTVRLPPYAWKLVGHPFKVGANPRVDAQFSAPYCVANAIVRRASKLTHFRVGEIGDPAVRALADRVVAVPDPAMDARGHTAVDVAITMAGGQVHEASLDIAPGFPGNDLSDAQQKARFHDCMAYAATPLPARAVTAFLDGVAALTELDDARMLVDALIADSAPASGRDDTPLRPREAAWT